MTAVSFKSDGSQSVTLPNGQTVRVDLDFLNDDNDADTIVAFKEIPVSRFELRARLKAAIVKRALQWTPGPHPTRKRVLYLEPHMFNDILRAGCTPTRKYIFPSDRGSTPTDKYEWEVQILYQDIRVAAKDCKATHNTTVHLIRPEEYPQSLCYSLSMRYNAIGNFCVITPKARGSTIPDKNRRVARDVGAKFGLTNVAEGPPAKRQRISMMANKDITDIDVITFRSFHSTGFGDPEILGNLEADSGCAIGSTSISAAAIHMMATQFDDSSTSSQLWEWVEFQEAELHVSINAEADDFYEPDPISTPINTSRPVAGGTPIPLSPGHGHSNTPTVIRTIFHPSMAPPLPSQHGTPSVIPMHLPLVGSPVMSDSSSGNHTSISGMAASPFPIEPASITSATVSTTAVGGPASNLTITSGGSGAVTTTPMYFQLSPVVPDTLQWVSPSTVSSTIPASVLPPVPSPLSEMAELMLAMRVLTTRLAVTDESNRAHQLKTDSALQSLIGQAKVSQDKAEASLSIMQTRVNHSEATFQGWCNELKTDLNTLMQKSAPAVPAAIVPLQIPAVSTPLIPASAIMLPPVLPPMQAVVVATPGPAVSPPGAASSTFYTAEDWRLWNEEHTQAPQAPLHAGAWYFPEDHSPAKAPRLAPTPKVSPKKKKGPVAQSSASSGRSLADYSKDHQAKTAPEEIPTPASGEVYLTAKACKEFMRSMADKSEFAKQYKASGLSGDVTESWTMTFLGYLAHHYFGVDRSHIQQTRRVTKFSDIEFYAGGVWANNAIPLGPSEDARWYNPDMWKVPTLPSIDPFNKESCMADDIETVLTALQEIITTCGIGPNGVYTRTYAIKMIHKMLLSISEVADKQGPKNGPRKDGKIRCNPLLAALDFLRNQPGPEEASWLRMETQILLDERDATTSALSSTERGGMRARSTFLEQALILHSQAQKQISSGTPYRQVLASILSSLLVFRYAAADTPQATAISTISCALMCRISFMETSMRTSVATVMNVGKFQLSKPHAREAALFEALCLARQEHAIGTVMAIHDPRSYDQLTMEPSPIYSSQGSTKSEGSFRHLGGRADDSPHHEEDRLPPLNYLFNIDGKGEGKGDNRGKDKGKGKGNSKGKWKGDGTAQNNAKGFGQPNNGAAGNQWVANPSTEGWRKVPPNDPHLANARERHANGFVWMVNRTKNADGTLGDIVHWKSEPLAQCVLQSDCHLQSACYYSHGNDFSESEVKAAIIQRIGDKEYKEIVQAAITFGETSTPAISKQPPASDYRMKIQDRTAYACPISWDWASKTDAGRQYGKVVGDFASIKHLLIRGALLQSFPPLH